MFSAETWLALSHPLVVTLLGSTILLIWRDDTQRPRYLLYFGFAYLVYSVAVTFQITLIPSTLTLNVLLSSALYMAAVVLLTHGLIALSDRTYPYWFPTLVIGVMLMGRFYFSFFVDNQTIRFYLLHASIALVLLHGAYLARNLLMGRSIDKVLYWSFLLLALSNVPRSLLVLLQADKRYGFDLGTYWLFTKVTIYVFSVVFALSLILANMQRRIVTQQALSETDALTGLRNRRGFYSTVTRMIPRVETYAILVADIDRFKKVNDTYGHYIGDIFLADAAMVIETSLRPTDVPGRIGGEEFAIFLPNTSLEKAHHVAERVRRNFENYVFAKGKGDLNGTISLGVTAVSSTTPLPDALSRADRLLYQAKATGRNRVVSSADLPNSFDDQTEFMQPHPSTID